MRRRAKCAMLALATSLALCACGRASTPERPGLAELRTAGPKTLRPELATQWLVSELMSVGGSAEKSRTARRRVEELGAKSMGAHLALAIDDAFHGRPSRASDHYLRAVQAARESADPRASLVAWFAAHNAIALEDDTTGLWERWQQFVDAAIDDPRSIGWRARSELAEWAVDQAWQRAEPKVEDFAQKLYGCASGVRLAGPFGRGATADAYRHFDAERPGPWPEHWSPEPLTGRRPRLLKVQQDGCAVTTDEAVASGIFYTEVFFDLKQARDVLIAVQGSLAVFVDDQLVLDRDIRQWGIWPKFGVQLSLQPGRHRIVARLAEPSTSIRLMRPDGTPLTVTSGGDPHRPYSLHAPILAAEPNELMRFIRDGNVVDPRDDLTRFVGAYLAHVENNDDVAAVMLEPLLEDMKLATGPVLALAAMFTEGDPIFAEGQAEDLVRELHKRAAERDPALWAAQLSLAIGEAARKGVAEAIPLLEKLVERFREVPEVLLALARAYGELGWMAEHDRAVKELARRFPNNLVALHAAVDAYEAEGKYKMTDKLVARIQRLDRDSEIVLGRALARRDYDQALAELRRIKERRPDRKDIAGRIYDVMGRAGNTEATWKKLEAAVEQDPESGPPRIELADARFAQGDHQALRRALATAVEQGAETRQLTDAIDLVEGMTALEPYRLPATEIIAEYERSGRHMPGTAARVLDYAALWVRADGSSRMLEHEIIRIQSPEGIEKFAEQERLPGLILHMRVIKQDGRALEPESVPGKPTVTFPHLEVGDYIETEQVMSTAGDGRGERYIGPRWFFREENVAYARSEFVVVSPKDKPLIVETTGAVAAPEIVDDGALVRRRWRVDFSPAAPVEPGSVPVQEFLPSVWIGWGVTLEDGLAKLSDAVADVTPVDPRVVRIAERIVDPIPPSKPLERARRLYRWVLDNVEEGGEESDGRRVVVGKQGNRWRGFMMLCRALGVPVRYAVAQNRLAAPPRGPLSRTALYTQPVVRVGAEKAVWLTLTNKFAPFGYVPAEVRGMPATFLDDHSWAEVVVPNQGPEDLMSFEALGQLEPTGSMRLDLVERFSGRLAISLRTGLSQLPEQRLREVIESNLLARSLPGAELLDYGIKRRDDLDAPLSVRMTVDLPRFAHKTAGALILEPPFTLPLARIAALPARQTPLLIGEALHRKVLVRIQLPEGATVTGLSPIELTNDRRKVTVADRIDKGKLVLDREVYIPAGRIQPKDYAAFADFARRADDALSRTLRVQLAR